MTILPVRIAILSVEITILPVKRNPNSKNHGKD
jgi:hypothetical protein